jgi:nicotinamide mononucleotide transporter
LNFSLLIDQVTSQDVVEWAGLISGIAYVILATYERPSCWLFGIVSSACIAWKSFTDYLLIADGILQVFYIVIGFYGLYIWIGRIAEVQVRRIKSTPVSQHLIAISFCLLISWPLSYVLIRYTSARYGYVDTALTLLSVWATLLLVRKNLHNWVYWVVIDILYVMLYWRSEGYLFSVLFFLYAVISVWGWKQWKGHYQEQAKLGA